MQRTTNNEFKPLKLNSFYVLARDPRTKYFITFSDNQHEPVEEKKHTKYIAFLIITILFFLWGAITSINDVLIDTYKKIHGLTEFQSMLLLSAFFGAYGIGSSFYFYYSKNYGDPINKLGYKRGIIIGLTIAAGGCFLLIPLTNYGNFYAYLSAFFTIGLGITLLQISCNPYISILGEPRSASARLNLSQGFNSLGTTIGPLFAGYLILSYLSKEQGIQHLFAIYGGLFSLLALILLFFKLPEYKNQEKIEANKSALQFRRLRFGMLAIFFYVGAEVTIGAKIIPYLSLPEIGGLNNNDAVTYLGIYWGGAMIGRLGISVISKPDLTFIKRVIMGLITISITYLVLVTLITIKSKFLDPEIPMEPNLYIDQYVLTLNELSPILPFIFAQFIIMLIFSNSSRKLMSFFALIIILLLITAFLIEGRIALWCILAIGLFNSILWSNIFTISIEGLGKFISQGSSLLIIMIIGGAVLPPLMGQISDLTGSIKYGFLFPIISYLYILYFGLFESKTKQNL